MDLPRPYGIAANRGGQRLVEEEPDEHNAKDFPKA